MTLPFGEFYVELEGDYPDGTTRAVATGPWDTREGARECIAANRAEMKREGATRIRSRIVKGSRS